MLDATMNLFALPIVGRGGLGNMLFPWARAELFARRSGARVLAPLWATARIGPYLRGEKDRRHYAGLFRAPHHVRGLASLAVKAAGRRITEQEISHGIAAAPLPARPLVVEHKGIDGMFAPLAGNSDIIRDLLWNMTRAPLRSDGRQYGGRFIAMHVRRGDIVRPGMTQRQLLEVKQYTPAAWFDAMAQAVRRERNYADIPIVIFTDGSRDEVAGLLALDNVRLHARRPAIADIWTLSHAGLLFASGYSTFGMWASYLGGMPTIYAPGKLQQRVQAAHPQAMEIELAQGAALPPRAFAAFT